MPIKASNEGKKALATELYRRFHAMKTYGKEPESLGSIVEIFTTDLAEYPAETILLAIKTHSKRSQEFPTVADIVGLIHRNGRPPLSRETYIGISKKDGEARTPDEWRYLRDYEAEQHGEEWGTEHRDQRQEAADRAELERLRWDVEALRDENRRLATLLHEARMSKGLERPKPSLEQQIQQTVTAMRQGGASEADVEEFLRPYGLHPEEA